jgi:hypothetical protein
VSGLNQTHIELLKECLASYIKDSHPKKISTFDDLVDITGGLLNDFGMKVSKIESLGKDIMQLKTSLAETQSQLEYSKSQKKELLS